MGEWDRYDLFERIGHGYGPVASKRGAILRSGKQPTAVLARQVHQQSELA